MKEADKIAAEIMLDYEVRATQGTVGLIVAILVGLTAFTAYVLSTKIREKEKSKSQIERVLDQSEMDKREELSNFLEDYQPIQKGE